MYHLSTSGHEPSRGSNHVGYEWFRLLCPGKVQFPEEHDRLVAKIDNAAKPGHPDAYLEALKRDIDEARRWFHDNVAPNISTDKSEKFKELLRYAADRGTGRKGCSFDGGIFALSAWRNT